MRNANLLVWNPENTIRVAKKVCADLGLREPILIRFAQSAFFRSGDVAVRVDLQHRTNFSGARLLSLTQYFCSLGVDTTLPYSNLGPVFWGDDFCVTFYQFIDNDASLSESIQAYHFGKGLRAIHDLATVDTIEKISEYGEKINLNYVGRKLENLTRRIDGFVASPPKGFSKSQMQQIQERFVFVRDCLETREKIYDGRKVVVHGDAHLGNIICSDNQVFLLDFEEVGFGFPFVDHLHIMFRDLLFATKKNLYTDFLRGYGESFKDEQFLFLWLELMTFVYFTWSALLGNESEKHYVEAIQRFSFWEKEWWSRWQKENKMEAPYLWNANM